MDLKELYKKEKGLEVDVEVGGLSVLYYSEKYVDWLEAKINYTRCCKSDSELLCNKCNREKQLQKLTDQAQKLGLGYDD
jgi:hypothetical protein